MLVVDVVRQDAARQEESEGGCWRRGRDGQGKEGRQEAGKEEIIYSHIIDSLPVTTNFPQDTISLPLLRCGEGAIEAVAPQEDQKIYSSVSGNKSSDRKLIFYILLFTKTLLTLQGMH